MKKGIIIGIIIGGIVFGCLGVYASATYLAKDITYKDNKNVEQAINDLYSKTNTSCTVSLSSSVVSRGTILSYRTATTNLNKGTYVVSAIVGLGMGGDSAGQTDWQDDNGIINITGNKNITVTKITSHLREQVNTWSRLHLYYGLYYVEVTNDNTTLTIMKNSDFTDTGSPEMLTVETIKIEK